MWIIVQVGGLHTGFGTESPLISFGGGCAEEGLMVIILGLNNIRAFCT